MPSVFLPVPHFEQSRDGMCLPACARMVMAYWGREIPEKELVHLFETKAFGTPISNVKRLEKWGYRVNFGTLTENELKIQLLANRPVIVRIWTPMLDYWDIDTSHVIVVVGFDDIQVLVNDPAFAEAPKTVAWNGFLAAWVEFDQTAAIIFQ